MSGLEEKSKAKENVIGSLYADLGDFSLARGSFDEARQHHETALEIKRTSGDRRGIAVSEAHLGMLALRLSNFAEARQRYNEALAVFGELNEPGHVAISRYQLGRVAHLS